MPQRRSGRQARDAWFASTVHRVSRCGRARGAQMPMARTCACGVFVVAVLGVSAPARAQADCFARVLASKNEQPHWMTPVVTVTPRLEQEFRYDTVWRHDPDSTNFGFGKGIELIPVRRVQVSVSVPPYVTRPSSGANGVGDMALLTKLRFWASPESGANGILTAFFGVTLPSGTRANGAGTVVLAPSIAAGKGWGNLDVQSTFGITIPVNGDEKAIAWNTALQLHLGDYVWPEIEANTTWFLLTEHSQLYLTPGLVLGRFRLGRRVGLAVGAGLSLPVSSYHTDARRWTLTIRFPFPM